MKRIFLCGLVFNSFIFIVGCDYKTSETTSSAVTTRTHSIAGSPVRDKDYLSPATAQTIQVSADIAH